VAEVKVAPARWWSSARLIEALADVMVQKGVPEHIRSDNGPEFVAKELRQWLADIGAKTLYIEPGSPWENGYCESFNSKLRDEFLNGEIFYSMKEIRVLAERWRSTTTPSGHTLRWATDRRHRRRGLQKPRGMEKWKPLRASHFSTPPTAALFLTRKLRYTNNRPGTKYRAVHYQFKTILGQNERSLPWLR
jgi:transposase InsO family protein